MQCNSLWDSHAEEVNAILREWVQRTAAVLVSSLPLLPNKGNLFGAEIFQDLKPISLPPPRCYGAHQKVFQMLVWLDHWTGQVLFMASQVLTDTASFPQKGSALSPKPQWGNSRRARRRRYLMKRHLQVWNPLWWEHCTCAEAEPGSREQGGARLCAKWVPGPQGEGSLPPSSASSLLGGPSSSVPPLLESWLQPWRESHAKFKSELNAKFRSLWRTDE